jgi:hypothetical protein
VTDDDIVTAFHADFRASALEPVAELDPGLRPWRGCAEMRVDVTVADLLPSMADQEVQLMGGPEWADR